MRGPHRLRIRTDAPLVRVFVLRRLRHQHGTNWIRVQTILDEDQIVCVRDQTDSRVAHEMGTPVVHGVDREMAAGGGPDKPFEAKELRGRSRR